MSNKEFFDFIDSSKALIDAEVLIDFCNKKIQLCNVGISVLRGVESQHQKLIYRMEGYNKAIKEIKDLIEKNVKYKPVRSADLD